MIRAARGGLKDETFQTRPTGGGNATSGYAAGVGGVNPMRQPPGRRWVSTIQKR